jgi:hypothetical protein
VASVNDVQSCLSETFRIIEQSCPDFAPTPENKNKGIRTHWLQFESDYWAAAVLHCNRTASAYIDQVEQRFTDEYNRQTPSIAAVISRVLTTTRALKDGLQMIRRPNAPPS